MIEFQKLSLIKPDVFNSSYFSRKVSLTYNEKERENLFVYLKQKASLKSTKFKHSKRFTNVEPNVTEVITHPQLAKMDEEK